MASPQFSRILRYSIITILLISFAYIGTSIIMKFKQEPVNFIPEDVEKIVSVQKVELQNLKSEIQLLGIIHSLKKIELFAEQTGILKNDNFEEGIFFKRGEIILDLNDDEFKQNLKAQKGELIMRVAQIIPDIKIDFPEEFSIWDNFFNTIDLNKKLPELPELNNIKLKRFIAGKGLLNLYFNIESLEKKIDKFTIEAPFDGEVTEAIIQKGALVRIGQKLGEFINTKEFEFESEASITDLDFLKVGTPIKFKSNNHKKNWKGIITRINSKIDSKTQRIKIYAKVEGEGIRDGLYVNAYTEGIEWENVYALNRQLIENNKVYVVENHELKLKEIEILFQNDSKAFVKGLNTNDLILSNNLKGIYEGMKVKTKINN